MSGFLKLTRGETVEDLLYNHPNEFRLLTIIAYRARRSKSVSGNLQPGEALIGDWKKMGFSQQQYRTAKSNVQAWGFITTKATNKGTIAKLSSSTIFDINIYDTNDQINEQVTTQPTINQRAGNEQTSKTPNVYGPFEATKKERKKECKETKTPRAPDTDLPRSLSESSEFVAAWESWKSFRKEIRKPLTPSTIEQQLRDFEDWGPSRAVAAIRFTIGKGWQGLQEPPKTNGYQNGHTPKWKIEAEISDVIERFKTADEKEKPQLKEKREELERKLRGD